MPKKHLTILLILIRFTAFSQEETETYLGSLSGNWQNFYMQTSNKGNLKDWRTLATGGFLKYHYELNNFQFASALYTSIDTGIQDLTIADAQTGKLSRYEEGLYDRLDLDDPLVLILGELYGRYSKEGHQLTLGRMKFASPMLNGQDGRMIPTLFQGFHYSYKNEKTQVQAAIFNAVAPRSTGRFFQIGESIGTYPVGRDNSGQEAQYAGFIDSDFLLVGNFNQKIGKNLKVEVWDYYIENVSNSIYIRPSLKISKNMDLHTEFMHQDRLNNGGNPVDSLSYFQDASSNLFGLKLSYSLQKRSSVSLAYNRILSEGKFLFPREWGREFLFSFQKRERSEGSADNHALVAYFDKHFSVFKNNVSVHSILSAGHHWKPSVLDPVTNKYAMPDYTQLNLDLFLSFKKLRNLNMELLLVNKIASGDIPVNPNFYLNKVDMFQVNFIVNYTF